LKKKRKNLFSNYASAYLHAKTATNYSALQPEYTELI